MKTQKFYAILFVAGIALLGLGAFIEKNYSYRDLTFIVGVALFVSYLLLYIYETENKSTKAK